MAPFKTDVDAPLILPEVSLSEYVIVPSVLPSTVERSLTDVVPVRVTLPVCVVMVPAKAAATSVADPLKATPA